MIKINIHSMVDIITNSSTELFVLDTKKSLDFVKDILVEAIKLHNMANDTNYKFEDIFAEPIYGSGEDTLYGWEEYYTSKIKDGIIVEGVTDNSIPYWRFEFIESVFGYSTERFHLG
jgi:predicted metal-dependent RNase